VDINIRVSSSVPQSHMYIFIQIVSTQVCVLCKCLHEVLVHKICIFRALFESIQLAADGFAVKRVSLMFCITTIDSVMLALQTCGTCSLHVEERMPVELERRRSRSQNSTCLAAVDKQ
jgi:hypothetical protein